MRNQGIIREIERNKKKIYRKREKLRIRGDIEIKNKEIESTFTEIERNRKKI